MTGTSDAARGRPTPPGGADTSTSGHPGNCAAEGKFDALYEEIRRLAGRALAKERRGHTLDTTSLAHEVVLRLARQKSLDSAERDQVLGLASTFVRRILVDHARRRNRRSPGRLRVTLSDLVDGDSDSQHDILDVEGALNRLEARSPRQARIVTMRFFAGLSVAQVAQALGVSESTVKDDWAFARAWLMEDLQRGA